MGCGVAGVGWGGVGVEMMSYEVGIELSHDVTMLWVIRETDVYCNRTVYISNIYE